MSFLAGFAELGRLAALTVPAFSLQLPKRGRHYPLLLLPRFPERISSRGKGALVNFPAAVVRLFEQSDPEGQTMSNTHPENGPARID